MKNVRIELNRAEGPINIMHAVNNGPCFTEGSGNHEWFAKAGIPYARNHDASFDASYGGCHTVDISAVFPDFDADEYDAASYDFAITDVYVESCYSAGTKMFYRLGSRIEHEVKKYHIYPPKDFQKWAVVCEHVIRHYTEGWADGFHYDMPYWEIWNEPDYLDHCWIGDAETFYRLYHTAASHLKSCFPHLKIGGPAVTGGHPEWKDGFFAYVKEHGTPIDFFSFHHYHNVVETYTELIHDVQALLKKHGLSCELILNEWNFVTGWSAEDFVKDYGFRRSVIAAAFVTAIMTVGQREKLDMLMYYDARPHTGWNGLFDALNHPTKVYGPFYYFNRLYRMGSCVASRCESDDLYAVAATDGSGRYGCLIARYNNVDGAPAEDVTVRIEGLSGACRVSTYLLDDAHDGGLLRQDETFSEVCCPVLKLDGNAVVYLEIEPV